MHRQPGGTRNTNAPAPRSFAIGLSTLCPLQLEGKIFPVPFKRCLAEESSRRVRPTGIAIIASETRAALPGSNRPGRNAGITSKSWQSTAADEGRRYRAPARPDQRNLERSGSVGNFGANTPTMTQQSILRPRSKSKHAKRRVGAAFLQAATAGGVAPDFPMDFRDPDEGKSKLATGGISAAIHLGIIGLLFLFASLNPEIVDEVIPVMLLHEEAPKPPAPARRALAERRKLDFAPAMQTVQPQIINKRVIAEAAPAINTEMLEMDSLNAAAAPTQVKRSAIDVDRVSAIGAVGGYQASKVEVNQAAGPAVRGPIEAVGPVGPSVGPRKVAGTDGNTFGTGSLAINQGSSVRDGVLTSRDVVGSPTGAVLVSVDTAVGEGNLSGPGGTGTGLLPDGAGTDCLKRPEVQLVSYRACCNSGSTRAGTFPTESKTFA